MRILAIDYGTKRCGIAVTDELKLIAFYRETPRKTPSDTCLSLRRTLYLQDSFSYSGAEWY